MAGVDSFELILNNYILKDLKDLTDSLALIGIFYLGKITLKSILRIYKFGKLYLYPSIVSNETYLDNLGTWVCINGCTNSIGLGYVKELAKRKKNLILIDSDSLILDQITKDLIKNFGIEIFSIKIESSDLNTFFSIENELISKDVGLLINVDNFYSSGVINYHEAPKDLINREILKSSTSVAVLVRTLLPSMIQKLNWINFLFLKYLPKKSYFLRKKGAIVYVSSVNSLMPIPYDPILAASHSFIKRLFDSLNYEYRDKNIKFQFINTLVSCNSNDESDFSLMNLAGESLKYIGSSDQVVCSGNYYTNGLKLIFLNIIPRFLNSVIFSQKKSFFLN